LGGFLSLVGSDEQIVEPRALLERWATPATNGRKPTRDEQFAEARIAPGIVLPGAYSSAFAPLSGLAATGGSWTEVTSRPYNADDPRYRDPFASNSGAGNGLASGRIVAMPSAAATSM
jgi:hypothetical protein